MTLRPNWLLLALSLCLSWPVVAIESYLLPAGSNAPAESDPQAARLQEQILAIVDASGLTGLGMQARHVAQQILNDTNASLGQQYDVVDRIAPVWAPESLQQRLGRLLQGYNEQQRQQLLSILSSRPLLDARTKEQSAVQQQDSQAYLEYVTRLRQQQPAEERLRMIQELDNAMQFSGLLIQTRAAVYPQLQAVLRSWKPADNWQDTVRREVHEFLLYTYRSTPNHELQQLAEAWREPLLQDWLQAVRQQLGNS